MEEEVTENVEKKAEDEVKMEEETPGGEINYEDMDEDELMKQAILLSLQDDPNFENVEEIKEEPKPESFLIVSFVFM